MVGRASRWGNPFVIGRPAELRTASGKVILISEPTRDQVLYLYRVWLREQLKQQRDFLDSLYEATALGCYCPLDKKCHVDVLLEEMYRFDRGRCPHCRQYVTIMEGVTTVRDKGRLYHLLCKDQLVWMPLTDLCENTPF